MILAGAGFLAGVLLTFAGTDLAGRVRGLVLLATGSVAMLAVGAPADPSTWWAVGVGGLTLAGMVAVARWLSRRLEGWGVPPGLDEDLG